MTTQVEAYKNGAKKRIVSQTFTYASQAAATELTVGTLPKGASVTKLWITTSDSTGSATLAVGTSADADKYKTAAAVTTANVPQVFGLAAALLSPLAAAETVIVTTASAALPASGTLHVEIEYVIN